MSAGERGVWSLRRSASGMPENDAATARRQPLSPRRGQHFFETSPEAEEVRFATDSLLEGDGFEPSVPRKET